MAAMTAEATDAYIEKAMKNATVEKVEDNFFAAVPQLRGAWGDGKTAEQALADLRVVLRSWIDLALDDDQHLPDLD